MPMRSSYEAVVASYHVEDSEDEIDYDDAGLMSRRSPWSHPLIGESHQSFAMNAINSSEDEDEGKIQYLSNSQRARKLKKSPGQKNL